MIDFSLAVIAYNSEKTLSATLTSLERLEALKRVELILADDGSSDRSVSIMEEWLLIHSDKFATTRKVFSTQNLGVARTHTEAFAVASGVWGLYLGGDDLIDNPSFFSELGRVLARTPGKIFRTRVKEYYAEGDRTVDFLDSYRFVLQLNSRRQFRFLASSGTPFRSGPGTVFEVKTLRALDAFGSYNRMYEDWTMFLRFTRAGFPIRFLDVAGVLWQRHLGSVSSSSYEKMKSWDVVVRRKEVTRYLNRLSLYERWKLRNHGRIARRLNEWYRTYLAVLGTLTKGSFPKDIVVVRLDGQLGTQLFKYVTALALAEDRGSRVFYDSGTTVPDLAYKIGLPEVPADMAENLLENGASVRAPRWTQKWKSSAFRRISAEPRKGFWSSLKRRTGPIFLVGHWQSLHYFRSLSSGSLTQLRDQLEADLEGDPFLASAWRKVVVCVRRSDIIPPSRELKASYYFDAMELFPPETEFLFVSDDLEYCRSTYGQDPRVEIVRGPRTPCLDLRLMMRAQGVVIGNDGLGWWGAYLNSNPHKVVVAPGPSCFPGTRMPPLGSDFFPEDWTVL